MLATILRVLAENQSALEQIGAPLISTAGTAGVLIFMVRYFMQKTESQHVEYRTDMAARNAVIETLVHQSNAALDNNTRVVQEFTDNQREFKQAIRLAPCGEFLRRKELEKENKGVSQ